MFCLSDVVFTLLYRVALLKDPTMYYDPFLYKTQSSLILCRYKNFADYLQITVDHGSAYATSAWQPVIYLGL